MKIKCFLFLLILVTSLGLRAQSTTLLHGNWRYHDIYEKEKIDAQGLKVLQMFFGDMTMRFEENGRYSAQLMGNDEVGGWRLDEAVKTLTLASDDGKTNDMEIVSVTATDLTIKVGNGAFILKKDE